MAASSPHLIVETMEDRILHSADSVPMLLVGQGTETLVQQPMHPALVEAAVQRSEIVFLDAGLPDSASLLADLQAQQRAGRPVEIVTMAANQDGLALIGATLAGRQDISALHVLAHGSDGVLQLGSVSLDEQTLLRRAGEVAAWGAALTADADLLLYGCDLAQTGIGQNLVRDLASLTGADVAASTDLTGAAALGGNWTLEFHSGSIEAAIAPSFAEQSQWQNLLATYTVTNTADTALIILPAPVGSLRWAINQANANPGTDTINFASSANGTIALGFLASGDNTNASGDFDITDSVNVVGNGTGNTVISGNGFDRVFDLRSGTISLSGLTVQGGINNQGAGIAVQGSATVTLTDVVVQNNLGSGTSKGAGIYTLGSLTLRNVIVQNNGNSSSGDAQGAGIYVDTNANLDAQDVEIRGNNANRADGGGLYALDNATTTLRSATFAENNANNGGGLWLKTAAASLVNVTLSGNTATSHGGGLLVENGVVLDHVTVAYNAASSGGGVFDQGGIVTMANSLFVTNTGGNVVTNSGGSTSNALNSLDYNLSDDNSAGFTATHDLSNVAVTLSALANNGGFTRTHAIAAGSAARDAANPVTLLTADQRGVLYLTRPDIGAYEYNPFGQPPTVSAISGQSTNEDTGLGPIAFTVGDDGGAGSLVVTATSSNTALVPNASIAIGGSGANRTLTITPALNANSSANGGPATIAVSVFDGGSTVTTTFSLTVAAVNDAPTIGLPAPQSLAEDGSLTLSGVNAPLIADVDAGNASVQLTLAVTHGLLALSQTTGLAFSSGNGTNNASMTLSGTLSAINAALAGLQYRPVANYNGPDQLTLTVNDLGNSGAGGAQTTVASLAITVTAVNDAPTISVPPAQSVNEDGTLTLSGAAAPSIADVDAGAAPVQVTLNVSNGLLTLSRTTGLAFVTGTGSGNASMVFQGTQTAINAALAGLQYRPDLNYNGLDQLNLGVNDLGNTGAGGALSTNASVAITVAAINDAPVLGLPGTQATQLATPLVFSAASGNAISVSDPDAGSSVIQLTLSTVAQGNGTLSLGSTAGLTLATGNGTSLLVLLGTQANLNAALNTLRFTAGVSALARIDISADDLGNTGGGGAQLASGAVTILVDAGFPPTLALSRASVAFTENDPATVLDPLITVADVDSPTLASASVRIGAGFAGAEDVLVYTNLPATMGNITGSYSAGVLTLSSSAASATLAQWQAALRSLSYSNSSEAPSPGGRSVTLTVNDGSIDSPTATITVNVAAVNDAPVLAGANDLASIAEDPASNPGTLVSSLIAGHISDVDAAPLVGIAVTAVDNSNGSWQYSTDGSSWNALGGVTTSAARLLAADALTAVRFVPAANWNGTVGAGLTLRAWDQTRGAAGGTADASVNGASAAFSSAAVSIAVTVTPVNDAPVLASAIAGQTATQDAPFSFKLAPGTFSDVDGDPLTYAASLSSGVALPSWLSFNAATQTFTGTPANADTGVLAIRLTATDGAGASVFGDFNLQVQNVNDPPVLATPIADRSAAQDSLFSLVLPANTFIDVDATDVLAYAATLASGAALPAWLTFDATTQTFSGTPGNNDVGALVVRVTATDGAGASAFDDFNLAVANVNDAPVLANALSAQDAATGTQLVFQLPAASFVDPDVGDTLHYDATLANGSALPAWLGFDSGTRSFTARPSVADIGQVAVRVTATDAAGSSAQGLFAITVHAPVQPPPAVTVAAPTPTPTLAQQLQPEAASTSTPAIASDPVLAAAVSSVAPGVPAAPPPPAVDAALLEPATHTLGLAIQSISITIDTAPVSDRSRSDIVDVATTRPASRADSVLADMLAPQFSEISMSSLNQLVRSEELTRRFEEMQRQMQQQGESRSTVIASSIVVTGGVSIGYVVWLVRGGVLMSSMLSALPAWQMIDPLPVLAAARIGKSGKGMQGDDAEVERLFDERAPPVPPVVRPPGSDAARDAKAKESGP